MNIKEITKEFSRKMKEYDRKTRRKFKVIDIIAILLMLLFVVTSQVAILYENVIWAVASYVLFMLSFIIVIIYYNYYDKHHREEIEKRVKERKHNCCSIVLEILGKEGIDTLNLENLHLVIERMQRYTSDLKNPFSIAWDGVRSFLFPVIISFLTLLFPNSSSENDINYRLIFAFVAVIILLLIAVSPTVYRSVNKNKFIALDIIEYLYEYIFAKNHCKKQQQ